MIALTNPILGEEEKQALAAVIDSGWLTMGERVKAFESEFAKMHGVEDAVAVSSCTAALHLSLVALGIGPGDEVLVPALTFVATVNVVLYVGATPVFVDIESLDCPHLSFADAKAKITSRTKAVIVMHYAGCPVDLAEWRAFADASGLVLVEDAAHAPGVEMVGRVSDAAAFSFFANKNMTTAEGGMATARDASVLKRIRTMRSHAMTTGTLERHSGHAYSYDVTMLGYNYRIDEMRAAIGLCQLTHLAEWNAMRRKLTTMYRDLLAENCPEVIVPFGRNAITSAHILPAVLPETADRFQIMADLRAVGIQTSIHYPPVHLFSYYRRHFPGVELHKAESFCARVISLPLFPELSESDLKRVVRELAKCM